MNGKVKQTSLVRRMKKARPKPMKRTEKTAMTLTTVRRMWRNMTT